MKNEKLNETPELEEIQNKEQNKEYVFDENKEKYTITDFAMAEDELSRLEAENGKRPSFIVRLIDSYYERKQNRVKHSVNRQAYITLCILTGLIGGHRFYEKRYMIGFTYLILSTIALVSSLGYLNDSLVVLVFIPITMSFVDWMIAVPIKSDENGRITI